MPTGNRPTPVRAQPNELLAKTQGFAGGLNIRDPVVLLGPDDLARIENVVFDSKGGLAKRLGTLDLGPFPEDGEVALTTYPFIRIDGQTPHVLVQTTHGNLYYTDGPSVDVLPWTWTLITNTLDHDQPASYETFVGVCFFADGEQYSSWDGTTYTNYPDAPICKYIKVWEDTMWVTGDPLIPDRVYSSAAGDPTTFPALAYVDILRGDGDMTTGLFSDGLFLIVGKLKRMQVIYDPALFFNKTADFEKGLESHWSVVHMEDKLYYMSRLGVCWWQGDASSRLISYKIDRLFRPDLTDYSKTVRHIMAYAWGDKCGWIIPQIDSPDGNNLVIEYYPRYGPLYQISGNIGPGPWTIHRMPVSCFAVLRPTLRPEPPEDTEVLLAGGIAGKYFQMFAAVGTDDGVAFDSVVETGNYDFGDPINQKYLRRMKVLGRGTFYIQLKRNNSNTIYTTKLVNLSQGTEELWDADDWGDAPWGSMDTEGVQEALVNFDAYGRVFSLRITDGADPRSRNQDIKLGFQDADVPSGQWAFYESSMMAVELGLRG